MYEILLLSLVCFMSTIMRTLPGYRAAPPTADLFEVFGIVLVFSGCVVGFL